MEFKASTDITTKVITTIVVVYFIYTIYRMSAIIMSNLAVNHVVHISVIVLLAAILFLGFGLSVWDYRINAKSLIIVTLLYRKVINKEDIQSAVLADDKAVGKVMRTMGIGGLFGYYGWFQSSKLGDFFFYGTQRKNRIFIQLKNGEKYMITPDDITLIDGLK